MQTKAFFALLLLLVSLVSKAQQPAQHTSKEADHHVLGSPLPVIRFVDSNGVEYNNDSLAGEGNLFVMMFNPTCEHCESMTVNMGLHEKEFGDAKVFLAAAPAMGPYLSYFYNNTKVGEHPKFKVVLDSCDFIQKTFTYTSLPQINIYNSKRVLIKILTGTETMDELRPYLPKKKTKKQRNP